MTYVFIENDLRMTFKEQMSENEQMSEDLPRVKKNLNYFQCLETEIKMSRNVFICNHDSPGPRIVSPEFPGPVKRFP